MLTRFVLRQRGIGALDRQRGLPRHQILLRDVHLGGAHDLVALLLTFLGDLGQGRQTMGVEEIVRIEVLDIALIQSRQRNRLKLETVLR